MAALLESTVLHVKLQVAYEVHYFTLEDLHLVHQFVELMLVLDSELFLHIHLASVLWHAHSHPIVFLLNHVVDSLDTHEESEHGSVGLHCVFVEDDLKRPVTLWQNKKVTR